MRKLLIVLFLILTTKAVFGLEVKVDCVDGFSCDSMNQRIKKAVSGKTSAGSIKESLRFLLLDESFNTFEFEHGPNGLKIKYSQRPIIKEVSLNGKLEINEKIVLKTLRQTEGGFFDPVKLQKGIDRLRAYYRERGYEEVSIVPNISKTESGVQLNFNINTGTFLLIRDVVVSSDSKFLEAFVKSRLLKLKKKPWNLVNIKIEFDSLTRDLFGRGYFSSNLKLKETEADNGFRDLVVEVEAGVLFNFDFKGNRIISRGEIINSIKEFLLNNFEEVEPQLLSEAINNIYKSKGVYKTLIDYRTEEGKTKSGDSFRNIYFNIREGSKIPVKELSFDGVNGVPLAEVRDYFYENSSDLSGRDFLDTKFINDFPSVLKRFYLRRGFLFVEISKPIITFSPDKKFCTVKYIVNERQQSILTDIVFPNVEKELKDLIIPELTNKVGLPLNIVDLEEDLNKSLSVVRDHGYYFARIKELEPSKVLEHEANFNKSKIKVDFELGKKTRYEKVMVSGTNVTKPKVITREIKLEKGDLINPFKIQEIKNDVIALGLFSQVKITPFVTNRDSKEKDYFVNLLIQVTEKDFGSGEVAPGYRTDLGYKVSTKIAYNNLLGLNHSASIRAQTNIRDNLNSLDAPRKEQNKNLQEFLVRVNYSWPYAFPSRWSWFHDTNLSFSPSYEQRRLFSFDAQIFKTSATLNKDLYTFVTEGINKRKYKLTGSVKYQYETIRQFNASSEDNEGKFNIGGITPSINFDMRDNAVNPRSGAFFGLSMEFANPIFGSLDRDDLEINFWKFVSRNKFYYPVSNAWTLALSVSTGVQKNLETQILTDSSGNIQYNENGIPETRGFIPSIKVFRLDGPDAVRGFATSEINRLDSGIDISQNRIQNKAFFVNMKFEPRFSLNDSVIMGPFFDAGRIYVNNYKPLDLRTSAGVTLKFVTPAGTLDFDYGVKIKRRRLADGGREGFGRFHLSIGFF